MKKSLVFAMAMALGVSATAFAANPFSDVPAGHWAYASVAELAADGVVTGYPDGTFKGDATMTRYEMAQIVAKALAKGAINENDALVAEFADELDNLGVRVAKLEAKSDNVKLTGSFRARNISDNKGTEDGSDLRTRIGVAGSINADWTYGALIENCKDLGDADQDATTKFRRAWVDGSLGDVDVTAGRFNYTVGNGNVFDDEIDGIKASTKLGDVDVTLAYGRNDQKSTLTTDVNLTVVRAEYAFDGFDAAATFYGADAVEATTPDSVNVWTLGVDVPLTADISLAAEYMKANEEDLNNNDDGYFFGLSYKGADKAVVGSYGAFANYYNQARTTYLAHTTDAYTAGFNGFKGFGIGADYTVAKNVVASVSYYDTEDAKYSADQHKLVYTELNFYF